MVTLDNLELGYDYYALMRVVHHNIWCAPYKYSVFSRDQLVTQVIADIQAYQEGRSVAH